jgi:branched-subunit amino acid transport protein
VKLLALVLLMAAVTFISRVLPLCLVKNLFSDPAGGHPAGKRREVKFATGYCPDDRRPASPCLSGVFRHPLRITALRLLGRSLSLVPYAALGALIFPEVFAGNAAFPYAAAAGVSAAVVTSLLGGGLVPSVVASVAASFAVLILTGP